MQKSPANLSNVVREEARKFVESHQSYFEIAPEEIQQKIKAMLYENKLRRFIKRALGFMVRKVSRIFISVRQRHEIHSNIESLKRECDDLIEKIKMDQ